MGHFSSHHDNKYASEAFVENVEGDADHRLNGLATDHKTDTDDEIDHHDRGGMTSGHRFDRFNLKDTPIGNSQHTDDEHSKKADASQAHVENFERNAHAFGHGITYHQRENLHDDLVYHHGTRNTANYIQRINNEDIGTHSDHPIAHLNEDHHADELISENIHMPVRTMFNEQKLVTSDNILETVLKSQFHFDLARQQTIEPTDNTHTITSDPMNTGVSSHPVHSDLIGSFSEGHSHDGSYPSHWPSNHGLLDGNTHSRTKHYQGHQATLPDHGTGTLESDHKSGFTSYLGNPNILPYHGIGALSGDHNHVEPDIRAGLDHEIGALHQDSISDHGIGVLSQDHHHAGSTDYVGHQSHIFDNGIGALHDDHEQYGATEYPGHQEGVSDHGIGVLSQDHHHAGSTGYPGHQSHIFDNGIGALHDDHEQYGTTEYPGHQEGVSDHGIGVLSQDHHHAGSTGYPGHQSHIFDNGIGALHDDHEQYGTTEYPGHQEGVSDHGIGVLSQDHHHAGSTDYPGHQSHIFDNGIGALHNDHEQYGTTEYPGYQEGVSDHGIGVLSQDHHHAGSTGYPGHQSHIFDNGIGALHDDHEQYGTTEYPGHQEGVSDHGIGVLSQDHHHAGSTGYPGHQSHIFDNGIDALHDDHEQYGTTEYPGHQEGVSDHGIGALFAHHHHAGVAEYLGHRMGIVDHGVNALSTRNHAGFTSYPGHSNKVPSGHGISVSSNFIYGHKVGVADHMSDVSDGSRLSSWDLHRYPVRSGSARNEVGVDFHNFGLDNMLAMHFHSGGGIDECHGGNCIGKTRSRRSSGNHGGNHRRGKFHGNYFDVG